MLNKFTAAAISTVLCLNTAIPCISECSEEQTAEKLTAVTSSAVVINNIADSDETIETTEGEAPEPTSSAGDSQEAFPETATEPVEEEPVQEGSLGVTISYRLYEDGTLYIDGRGIMDNYSKSPFKSPELINKVIVSNNEGTILTIGAYVFSNCINMTEIYLPDTLISIEKNAFASCTSLSRIQFENADTVNDSELILSDSIEGIKESAFANCTSLESVIVPETTVSVGASAFSGCTSLKKAAVNGTKATIGEYVFNRCISLEDLTLPFAGYDPSSVNEDASTAWLGFMFGDAVSDDSGEYTYGVYYNSYRRHIPKSLENITVLGGKNIPAHAFDGFVSLKKISVPDDIRTIGAASFKNCTALADFDMPSEVTVISSEAFAGCGKLSFDIPGNVTEIGDKAFADCTSITEITVPEATEIIGESVFSGCTALEKAVIKGENAQMGSYIFNKCISLNDLTLPFAAFDPDSANDSESTAWLGFMFYDAVIDDSGEYTYGVYYNGYRRNIPKSLENITISGGKNIPANAFDGFVSLKKVTIPDDIQSIGSASFRNCTALAEFEMPSEVTSIGSEAFASCAEISVDIPENVTKIGDKAFAGCTSITEITVPEATEIIGDSVFSGCTALEKAVIKGENVQMGSYIFNKCISLKDLTLPFAAFDPDSANDDSSTAWLGFMFYDAVIDDSGEYTYGVYYNGYRRNIPKSLENITISGGNNIPANAFDGFVSLKKVTIPDDVQTIGASSFRNCTALTEFDMPSAVTVIGNEAFSGCESLPTADIPKGVTKIGSKAFAGCTSITEINVPKAAEIIGDSAFSGCTSLKKAVINGGSTQIGDYIFNGCASLEDLTLPFPAYSEDDANTENKNAWLGFMFGNAISDDSGSLSYGAYYGGYTRHIPNSLKNITFIGGEYVANHLLQGFGGIENVSLPETIKEIGTGAFDGCDNLLNVFYDDTEEAWEDVNIKEKNESIDGKIVFFVPGVLGDTNGDGVIDASDASNILVMYARSSTGYEPPTKYDYSTADVNKDGVIDATDASSVLAYYAYASTSEEKIDFEEFMKNQ